MSPTETTSLRVERTFDAPAEAVFDAWTNPEVLRRWFAASESMRTPVAEVDLRVGGAYRLSMEDPDAGTVHTVRGEYSEISRPERLVYSWFWEQGGSESPHVSTVEVRFIGDGDRTTVVLEHSGLESPQSAEQHRHGWEGCLNNLGPRVLTPAAQAS